MNLYNVLDLFQNNMLLGEDGNMNGTEVNRMDGCWSWTMGTWGYILLFVFVHVQNFLILN